MIYRHVCSCVETKPSREYNQGFCQSSQGKGVNDIGLKS